MLTNTILRTAVLAVAIAAASAANAAPNTGTDADPSKPVACGAGTYQGLSLGADGGRTVKYKRSMGCFTTQAACERWVMQRTSSLARIVATRCWPSN